MKVTLDCPLIKKRSHPAMLPPTHLEDVVHEKRATNPNRWSVRDVNLNPRTTLPVRVGLKQQNLEHGYNFLMDVSHPSSPN